MKQFARLIMAIWLYAWMIAPSSGDESLSPAMALPSASKALTIPFKKEPKNLASMVGQSILTLLLVIGIVAGTIYVAKKYLPKLNLKSNSGQRLTLVEVLRLTTKTTLFVVRFDNTTLLLGQHGDSISLLSTQAIDPQSPTPTQV